MLVPRAAALPPITMTISSPSFLVDPKQLNRPTRERLLIAMWQDDYRRDRRPLRNLGMQLGIQPPSVNEHLCNLQSEGLVQKLKRGHWSITDLGRSTVEVMLRIEPKLPALEEFAVPNTPPQPGEIPLAGPIAAGDPIEMIDSPLIEALVRGTLPDPGSTALPTVLFPGADPQKHFAMTVRGDSMVHQCISDGDIAIFRYASGWEGWDNVHRGDIIAAAVPESANVDNPEWLSRALAGGFASELDRRYVTLKQYEGSLFELVGRYGRIKTIYRPIGVLQYIVRHYGVSQ